MAASGSAARARPRAERHSIRLTVTAYPADRNQFVVAIGQVPPHVQCQRQEQGERPGSRAAGIAGR